MVAVKKRSLPVFTLPEPLPQPAQEWQPSVPAKSPQGVLPHLHSCLFPQFQWRALRLEGSVPRGFILDSLISLSFILC